MKRLLFVLGSLLLVILQGFCNYYSQFNQDRYVNEQFFHNKRRGVFVDIGANDGVLHSNSYFFEKHLNWNGIAIEPIPATFALLKKARKCHCFLGCIGAKRAHKVPFLQIQPGRTQGLSGIISNYDPRHVERINRELRHRKHTAKTIYTEVFPLGEVLDKFNIDHIDFLSIDTEGSELDILKSIDYNKYTIDVITVENNYEYPEFTPFLISKGFVKHAVLKRDEIFVRKKFLVSQKR